MASDQSFADFVVDQLRGAGDVSAKKMFGEYAVYLDTKVVALICDNQLFLRPTAAGRQALGNVREAPPFPRAKPHLLVVDQLDDARVMAMAVRATADELPVPKPKKAKGATGATGAKVAKPKTVGKPAKPKRR